METDLKEPEWLLPFDALEVESFFIPTLKPANMLYIVDTRAKVAKCKIKACITTKDGCLGVRVWKTR